MKEQLRDLILSLPGVAEGKSRFGGNLAYTVEKREFAHFHSDTEIDIRLPKSHQRRLSEELRAIQRPRPASDWLPVTLSTPEDIETAFLLIQAAYASRV